MPVKDHIKQAGFKNVQKDISTVHGHCGTSVLVWMELTVVEKKREKQTKWEMECGIERGRVRNRKGDTNCSVSISSRKTGQKRSETFCGHGGIILLFLREVSIVFE